MKIYTKKGDRGDTSLFGGDRVSKSTNRIEAYGTVDELNSWIGLVLSQPVSEKGSQILDVVQDHLFVLGADLATPRDAKQQIERIREHHTNFLEDSIDNLEQKLPEIKNFILPGGDQIGAHLHVARTICRRAERAVVRCSEEEDVSPQAVKYLNRLSDLLFVMARYENKEAGTKETTWKPKAKDD